MSTERIPVILDDWQPKPERKPAAWPRLLIGLLLVLIAGLSVYGVVDWIRTPIQNFGVVQEEVLYRSAQPTLHGLSSAVARNGIWTVIDARPRGAPQNDARTRAEAFYCRNHNVDRIVLGGGSESELTERFLKIVTTRANQAALIYDADGDRVAGLLCAAYRIHEQHWTAQDAMSEMASYGAGPAEMARADTFLKAFATDVARNSSATTDMASEQTKKGDAKVVR